MSKLQNPELKKNFLMPHKFRVESLCDIGCFLCLHKIKQATQRFKGLQIYFIICVYPNTWSNHSLFFNESWQKPHKSSLKYMELFCPFRIPFWPMSFTQDYYWCNWLLPLETQKKLAIPWLKMWPYILAITMISTHPLYKNNLRVVVNKIKKPPPPGTISK